MKKNKMLITLITLIAVFAVIFVAAGMFFAIRGLSASMKVEEYFDHYERIAAEYIKNDSEMVERYGEGFVIRFDETRSYKKSNPRKFIDFFTDVFAPSAPESLEEFAKQVDSIYFTFEIKSDDYRIAFEKNGQGELTVTGIEEIK